MTIPEPITRRLWADVMFNEFEFKTFSGACLSHVRLIESEYTYIHCEYAYIQL